MLYLVKQVRKPFLSSHWVHCCWATESFVEKHFNVSPVTEQSINENDFDSLPFGCWCIMSLSVYYSEDNTESETVWYFWIHVDVNESIGAGWKLRKTRWNNILSEQCFQSIWQNCCSVLTRTVQAIFSSSFPKTKVAWEVVDCPARWSLWYWYMDFYVDHLYFDTQMTEKYSTAMCYPSSRSLSGY